MKTKEEYIMSEDQLELLHELAKRMDAAKINLIKSLKVAERKRDAYEIINIRGKLEGISLIRTYLFEICVELIKKKETEREGDKDG
jgi:hypothetical protein